MLDRIKERWRQAEYRRFFGYYLGAKIVGVLLCLAIIKVVTSYWFHPAFADDAAAAATPPTPAYINPINTMWTVIAAFLVFFMQAGFMFLEAGFARTREAVNVLLEGIVDTCLCGLLFYAWGFAFMFAHGNGFIGYHWFFLQGVPDTYEGSGVAFLAFWLFQYAFADTCSTVTSGAMVGRTGFWGDLIYSFGVSGFIYPIIGHWAWGPDGWLATLTPMAFHDFAGSTVVHTIGGFISLAGAMVLGPRIGRKFKRDGGGPMPAHNMTLAAVGGVILWFGWYGFNPGSTLSGMDMIGCGRVAANTTLAACAGGLTAMFWLYPRDKKWDCGITINGFLAGLVAITCPCYWVSPTGAVILGAIAGIVVIYATDLMEYLRIDDPVGAWPVHGACGIWGTLSLGLFACGKYGVSGPTGPDDSAPVAGLFYGGGMQLMIAQLIGSAAITAATFGVSLVMFYLVKMTGTLRVSRAGELEGMDIHEHGTVAYPETPTIEPMAVSSTSGSGGLVGAPVAAE